MNGLVIRSTGSWYYGRTDDGQLIPCKVKGNFRLRGIRSTNPVAVGDRVGLTFTATPHQERSRATGNESTAGVCAFITEIFDRRNYIIRRASNLSKQSHIIAANVDLACLIVTIAHPETYTTFIDRFLASAEAYRVPVALLFNKVDLYNEQEKQYLKAIMHLYQTLGYPCFAISAVTGIGLELESTPGEQTLLSYLQGKTTLFSGNSGVGKSTLLNRLVPSARARTAALSETHDQGLHTTTFSELYELPPLASHNGSNATPGAIIDTPGIRGFGTFDFNRSEVSHYFREIFSIGRNCRFSDCTHTHEPGCAVLTALKEHEIAESRYRSYLSMLEDEDESKYREKF